jgi:hypothetical protein
MTSPTSSEVLARALIPTLRARESATTAARDVSRETIEGFHRAGLLRLLQPRRFGGHQTFVRGRPLPVRRTAPRIRCSGRRG